MGKSRKMWVFSPPKQAKPKLPNTVRANVTAEANNLIFADGQAVWEGDFIGKHVGEFAGIPATGKDVRVPLCVVYDLQNDQIKRARVYFEMPVLMVFLAKAGLVSVAFLNRHRKYAILLNFVIAAILTPTPDIVNQMMMGIPLLVLYEVSVLAVWFFGRRPFTGFVKRN